jgi:hypothetical protein
MPHRGTQHYRVQCLRCKRIFHECLCHVALTPITEGVCDDCQPQVGLDANLKERRLRKRRTVVRRGKDRPTPAGR